MIHWDVSVSYNHLQLNLPALRIGQTPKWQFKGRRLSLESLVLGKPITTQIYIFLHIRSLGAPWKHSRLGWNKSVHKTWKLSRPPVNFQGHIFVDIPFHLETFQAIWNFSRPCVDISCNLETIQAIWKLSRPSGNCPGHLETVQAIWKLSRPSRNYPGLLQTVQAIWKLSRPSGNCPGHPETVQAIWKLSRPPGNCSGPLKTFQAAF